MNELLPPVIMLYPCNKQSTWTIQCFPSTQCDGAIIVAFSKGKLLVYHVYHERRLND